MILPAWKQLRLKRMSQGFCWICGKRKASEGRKTCPECAKMVTKSQYKRRARLRSEKICTYCGQKPIIKGSKLYCKKCANKAQRYKRTHWLKRLSKGSCVRCGKKPVKKKHGRNLSYCSKCAKKELTYIKKKRQDQKEKLESLTILCQKLWTAILEGNVERDFSSLKKEFNKQLKI